MNLRVLVKSSSEMSETPTDRFLVSGRRSGVPSCPNIPFKQGIHQITEASTTIKGNGVVKAEAIKW